MGTRCRGTVCVISAGFASAAYCRVSPKGGRRTRLPIVAHNPGSRKRIFRRVVERFRARCRWDGRIHREIPTQSPPAGIPAGNFHHRHCRESGLLGCTAHRVRKPDRPTARTPSDRKTIFGDRQVSVLSFINKLQSRSDACRPRGDECPKSGAQSPRAARSVRPYCRWRKSPKIDPGVRAGVLDPHLPGDNEDVGLPAPDSPTSRLALPKAKHVNRRHRHRLATLQKS